jgi:uncharacterized protein (DUF305 family)
MIGIMLLASALSTMNMWADNWSDMRYSINDVYMATLMAGWMCVFMGLFYNTHYALPLGAVLVLTSIWCIRTQAFVSEAQYVRSMIPHHSMAVHMSKQLLGKRHTMTEFVTNIIRTQSDEITTLKSYVGK